MQTRVIALSGEVGERDRIITDYKRTLETIKREFEVLKQEREQN